jgi:hypothetical protein
MRRPSSFAGPRRNHTGPVIYIYRSAKKDGLNAFSGKDDPATLPAQFAPWISAGNCPPGRALPHGLSRTQAEETIAANGFALWRMKAETPSS